MEDNSPIKNPSSGSNSRRSFFQSASLGLVTLGLQQLGCSPAKKTPIAKQAPIEGLENLENDPERYKGWKPVSDRKIRMGLVGYGLSKFGAAFGFQDHPNVEVVAVSDLFPDRCAAMAKACRCNKTYPSLEELVKDDEIEAVFLATDAPGHADHAMLVLQHGKHVASCVPAVFNSIEKANELFEAVKKSGLKYMMFETSCFHPDLYAMRQIYKAGGFGKLVYSEGEYNHYSPTPLDSYNGWRIGMPPMWYGTHSCAYYVGVTDGTFTEVSCMGMPSNIPHLQAANNKYKNPFGTEIALYRTSEDGMSRMMYSKDTAGFSGVWGRLRGQRGTFYEKYEGLEKNLPNLKRPPLPAGVPVGGHRGSHGNLTEEFITAILQDRKPLVDIATALNLSVPGIIAHQSALKNGELMKIPPFKFMI